MIRKTPLEAWIASKIGMSEDTLTREQISGYQLRQLRETIERTYHNSPFYRKRMKGIADVPLTSLDDIRRFPFTIAEDIRQQGLQFLCVSQNDINRVVTLDSSGTTGSPKRLYFTPTDQELTVDFFHQGMSTLVDPGDRVLILLPGERIGTVGDLLATALTRMGAHPIPHGVVRSIDETLGVMMREGVDSLVGIPAQILVLARYAKQVLGKTQRLKSALLSTDYVPRAIVRELQRLWGCDVFEHYGMTEMGLGGGVDCAAHAGYHLREADLYFEIINPVTGDVLPEGGEGEVVVTTLTRQGMPLIRYRTGDLSCFIPERCACGTVLRRMERVSGRTSGRIAVRGGESFTLADLDEALFTQEQVIDISASVDSTQGASKLNITATILGMADVSLSQALHEALDAVPAIERSIKNNVLTVSVTVRTNENFLAPRVGKRTITESGDVANKDDLSRKTRQNTAAR
jgi:phenylacetate-coenzyme A ligase PaaK-like adenylate-forming protein